MTNFIQEFVQSFANLESTITIWSLICVTAGFIGGIYYYKSQAEIKHNELEEKDEEIFEQLREIELMKYNHEHNIQLAAQLEYEQLLQELDELEFNF